MPAFTPDSLEDFLASRSYIEGNAASQADVIVYKSLSAAPTKPNSARWYKHIATFANEFDTLPGDKARSADSFGPAVAAPAAAAAADDDDDVDLFGSDEEEDAEAERLKAERLAEYNAKKAAKPKVVHKSAVTLDIKPWDDETDMKELEKLCREIERDGLVWGAAALVPIGYGVSKLRVNLVVEDEKVSLDELQEAIQDLEDHVQSTDIAAMQKL